MPLLIGKTAIPEARQRARRCWSASAWAIAWSTSRPSCPVASASVADRPRPGQPPGLVMLDEPTGNLDPTPPRASRT
jgi:hypothetical protein